MSDDEDGIPPVNVCQQRVEEFAEITGTDEACAHFFLQDRGWDLERSVNAFFEAKQSGGVNVMEDHDADSPVVVINVNKSVANQLSAIPPAPVPTPRQTVRPMSYKDLEPSFTPPSQLTFITWNIDGLDSHNLKKRTQAVCEQIFKYSPDVAFLQEVTPETLSHIKGHLPEYQCIVGGEENYFTATLLRLFTVYCDSHKIVPYSGSIMGRNLLVTEAHIGALKLTLLNTHLESTPAFADERVRQLKQAFEEMKAAPASHTVIFAGDLNLRDKELDSCGGLPNNVIDLWEAGGSRPECRYTWDMARNTNPNFSGKFKPRCRYDRAYLRPADRPKVHPKFFGLIGLEKVSHTESFPSDHWGIMAHFAIPANSVSQSVGLKRKHDDNDGK